MRWLSLKAAALRASKPADARGVSEEVVFRKTKVTRMPTFSGWPAVREGWEGERCDTRRMRSIGACGPHIGQVSVVQGTSTSRDLLIVHDPLLKFTRQVSDWTRHLSLQHVDIHKFVAEEAVREGADPSRASSRAPTCQGGHSIKVDRRRRNELCSTKIRTSARADRPNPLEPF